MLHDHGLQKKQEKKCRTEKVLSELMRTVLVSNLNWVQSILTHNLWCRMICYQKKFRKANAKNAKCDAD
jgi:hypothetical protein